MTAQPQPTGLACIDGRYRCRSLLGVGATGEVWLADDERLARPVAIKLARPGAILLRDGVDLPREARLLGQCRHPSIVDVFDGGNHEGRDYLVMEFVPGASLRETIDRRGALSPSEVVRIGAALAGALAQVHATGLAHGDVKPENILLADSGAVKLADFGVAIPQHTLSSETAASFAGTLAYMAPEMFEQGPSASADVYALGVVLAEALGAERARPLVPVPGAAMALPVATPPALGAAIRTALRHNPATRPTAAELEILLGNRPSQPTVAFTAPFIPRPQRRSTRRWAAALLALALLASVGAAAALLPRAPSPVEGDPELARAGAAPATTTATPIEPTPTLAPATSTPTTAQPPATPETARPAVPTAPPDDDDDDDVDDDDDDRPPRSERSKPEKTRKHGNGRG